MNVQLISRDRALYRLCREVLCQVAGEEWTLSVVTAGDAGDDFDLTVWEYEPGTPVSLPADASRSKYLFVVERNELPAFREQTGMEDAQVLLKPVTRPTLATFVGVALNTTSKGTTMSQTLKADRDEILQCLIQANLRLQEYDQDRTTFLARGLHDFRAPLTAISGYCGLLLSEPMGPLTESQREVLQRMHHSSKRLSRMASAMFQLSVGRRAKRRSDLQPGDIRQCVDQAIHEITPYAEDKSLTITTDFAHTDRLLHFDAGQVEQLLINILDNACKFTPKAGSIDMRGYPYFWERRVSRSSVPLDAERRHQSIPIPNSYRLDTRNSGNAIPSEYLQTIFEEYTSFGAASDRSGGGLGLAIARMIVSEHEGRVWAENTDQGPMFCIVLPM